MKSNTYFLLLLLPWFIYSSQPQPLTIFQKDNRSPLLRAVLQKKDNEVEALLKTGANPNILYLNKPLIHYVIKQGNLQIATLMVNAGADFSGTIDEGQDAFTYISTHTNNPTVSKKGKDDWCYVDCDLLYAFISHGYDLQENFNNNNLQNNAWYLALKNNQAYRIPFLLGQNKEYPLPYSADPNQIFNLSNYSSSTPLLILLDDYLKNFITDESRKKAMSQGLAFPQIRHLLKAGANINQIAKPDKENGQHNPLSYALLKKDDGYMIMSLIENGASIEEAFKLFIKNGGSSSYAIHCRWFQSNFTVSLLGIALEQKNIKVIKLLLDAGADVNQLTTFLSTKGTSSYPPLHYALQLGNPDIIELILDKGGKI